VDRDALFVRFVVGLFVILILYGAGMGAMLLFGDSSLASKMLSGFASMFAGILGLGSGYLLGARANGNGKPHE
jgi:hypothetical protein